MPIRAAATPHPEPPERDFTLPPGTQEVIRVYVNGIERRPGVDYEVQHDRVRFRRPLRPRARLTRLGKLMIALCAGVYPEGDEVDVIVRRRGMLETIRPEPPEGT